jgi:thiol:disulfide interchange protein DsbD
MNKRGVNLIATMLILVISAFVLLFMGFNKESEASKQAEETKAPEVKIHKDSAGEEQLNLYIRNGKPTLLYFTSDYCRDCQEVKPVIESLKKKYEDQVDVLIVDIRASDALSKEAIKQYRVLGVPMTVFVKKDGSKYKVVPGSYPEETYERHVQAILK